MPGEPSSRTRSASVTRASVASSIAPHERRRHLAQKRLGARLLAAQHVAQHVRRRARAAAREHAAAQLLARRAAQRLAREERLPDVRREHLCVRPYNVQACALKSASLH